MGSYNVSEFKKVDFRLPIHVPEGSELKVEMGDQVKVGEVVAVFRRVDRQTIDVLQFFHTKKFADCKPYIKKILGDPVDEGETIAEKKDWMGKKFTLSSPVSGLVEEISEQGLITIKQAEIEHEITAPINGKVVVAEEREIEIEAEAVHWQGVYGYGVARWGPLEVWPKSDKGLRLEDLDSSFRDKVLVVDDVIHQGLWFKASAMGVAGIVCAELPSNFESWAGQAAADKPALVAIRNDGEKIESDVLKAIDKLKHAYAFLFPEKSEVVLIDNRHD